MGWVKGFGLSLLRDIVICVKPSAILSLCTGNPRKDVALDASWLSEGVKRRAQVHSEMICKEQSHQIIKKHSHLTIKTHSHMIVKERLYLVSSAMRREWPQAIMI
jgi:polynucleotide 5'-kinase involved in rRNA processing